jgi:serine/threonine protein kinase
VSLEARDLAARMLTPDPAARITVDEVFRHPFFTQGLHPEWWLAVEQLEQHCLKRDRFFEVRLVVGGSCLAGSIVIHEQTYSNTGSLEVDSSSIPLQAMVCEAQDKIGKVVTQATGNQLPIPDSASVVFPVGLVATMTYQHSELMMAAQNICQQLWG